jgi:hypothetical protein
MNGTRALLALTGAAFVAAAVYAFGHALYASEMAGGFTPWDVVARAVIITSILAGVALATPHGRGLRLLWLLVGALWIWLLVLPPIDTADAGPAGVAFLFRFQSWTSIALPLFLITLVHWSTTFRSIRDLRTPAALLGPVDRRLCPLRAVRLDQQRPHLARRQLRRGRAAVLDLPGRSTAAADSLDSEPRSRGPSRAEPRRGLALERHGAAGPLTPSCGGGGHHRRSPRVHCHPHVSGRAGPFRGHHGARLLPARRSRAWAGPAPPRRHRVPHGRGGHRSRTSMIVDPRPRPPGPGAENPPSSASGVDLPMRPHLRGG